MLPLFPFASPILNAAEVRQLEKQILKDDPRLVRQAMQAVGEAFITQVLEDFKEISPAFPEQARVLLLLGKGHNAGDALYAIQALCRSYPKATIGIIFACGMDQLKPLVAETWEQVKQLANIHILAPNLDDLPSLFTLVHEASLWDLCIDGIYGFGFRPPLAKPIAELLKKVNSLGTIQLRAALDLPSGLAEDQPSIIAFRADFSYLAGFAKAAAFVSESQPHAEEYTGRIRLLDSGWENYLPQPPVAEAFLLSDTLLAPLKALRPSQSHKKTYGHLLIIAGSRSMPGALWMSARAALKSGLGLLTIACPASLVGHLAPALPEAMWLSLPETAEGELDRSGSPHIQDFLPKAHAVLIGPGLGKAPSTLALVETILPYIHQPLVLDADALQASTLSCLHQRSFSAPVYLTPHRGEALRLLGIKDKRLDARSLLKALAQASPAQVYPVLKGSRTAIWAYGKVLISPFGGPVLARGGSGDMLSGLLAGLVSQSYAQERKDLLLPLLEATVWHGKAADLLAQSLGQRAVESSSLLSYLSPALRS